MTQMSNAKGKGISIPGAIAITIAPLSSIMGTIETKKIVKYLAIEKPLIIGWSYFIITITKKQCFRFDKPALPYYNEQK